MIDIVVHRVMNRPDEVVTCLVRAGFARSTNVSTVIDTIGCCQKRQLQKNKTQNDKLNGLQLAILAADLKCFTTLSTSDAGRSKFETQHYRFVSELQVHV